MKKIISLLITLSFCAVLSAGSLALDHKVVKGDTMWKLSRRFGISLQSVIDANPQVADPDLIYPDEILHIPVSGVLDYEYQVVTLVNTERAKYGLSPLTFSAELSRLARLKSQDMRDRKYFSHQSPTYGSPFQMMKDNGVKYLTAGENIAMGQRTPSEVVNAWMASPGHRANILNSSFDTIGVGYAAEGNYWTQMFTGGR